MKNVYLLFSLLFISSISFSQEVLTQTFSGTGDNTNPLEIIINIPDDITVGDGAQIESITVSAMTDGGNILMDIGMGTPLEIPAECGDIFSFQLEVDGASVATGCAADIVGVDVSSATVIRLISVHDPMSDLMPHNVASDFTLEITFGDGGGAGCAGIAGENGQQEVCSGESIDLMSVLGGNPELGGTWYDYNNQVLSGSMATAPTFEGEYNYKYVVEEGDCIDEATISLVVVQCDSGEGPEDGEEEEDDTSSISAELLENIQLFPNPTNGVVTIASIPTSNVISVTVVDMNGRQLESLTYAGTQQVTLDLSMYQNGIYFIQLNGEGFDKVYKIVKE